MLDSVRAFLHKNRLLAPGGPTWVAVSGGADSMVLLHVLRELGYPCHVAHVDHGLRGAESDADRAFVQDYCHAQRIPFVAHRVDVMSHAALTGTSTQMAARTLRYAWFNALVRNGPDRMALAHHADDAVETFFMGMMQGMGLHGWETIPLRSGSFIRPLLGCRREEILDYARANHIPWREDASNADTHYLRNRIRHELLPQLEEWRPGTHHNLTRNVHLFRELDQLAQEAVNAAIHGLVPGSDGTLRVPFDRLRLHGAPLLTLHHLLRAKDFHPDQLESILQAVDQKRTGAVFLRGGHQVAVDRTELVIGSVPGQLPAWLIGSLTNVPRDLPMLITTGAIADSDVANEAKVVRLDPDALVFPLALRPWREGDRMRPAGLGGSKLISDILIDAKVPLDRKQRTYVLVQQDRIIWLCGHRLAEGIRSAPDSTNALRFEWTGA